MEVDSMIASVPLDNHSSDELFIFQNDIYTPETQVTYIEQFKKLCHAGKILSSFNDETWTCSNEIKKRILSFSMNRILYETSFGGKFRIHYSTMSKMLRYYAISRMNHNIFATIARHLNIITYFLTHYGRVTIKQTSEECGTIVAFLCFIGMDNLSIDSIQKTIFSETTEDPPPRELSAMINYYILHDAVNEVSKRNTKEFIHWFPIYFWCNITFIIPLRATEMLVTPFNCITRENGKVYLTLRRSKLKKTTREVFHEVEKDYKLFHFIIPDEEDALAIEKYQKLTQQHSRRFLFDFTGVSANQMLSLRSFNALLEEFIHLHIFGNHKYDYARYTSGLTEFEVVSAGDSRHLALSNMFCQGVDLEVCRKLADHSDITTTAGYCSNILNTLEASSIMKIQREMFNEYASFKEKIKSTSSSQITNFKSFCSAPEQPHKTGNITPCVKNNYLETCIGCQYYTPSDLELTREVDKRKAKLLKTSKALLKCLTQIRGLQVDDIDKMFLEVHVAIARYQTVCDQHAKEMHEKWLAQKSSQVKTF